MQSTFNLLLITALACVVMLFVLGSLIRSRIDGVFEWALGNVLAIASLVLFALRGVAPDVLSVVLANSLLAAALGAVMVGFCRFLGRRPPMRWLLSGLVFVTAGITVFFYVQEWMAARIVIVSVFHCTTCLAIAGSVLSRRNPARNRYPTLFTGAAAISFGVGHAVRGVVYASGLDVLVSTQQDTMWNVVFLSIGVIVMPALTLGAMLMVHRRVVTEAENAASKDFLTGAWSRRAFFSFAAQEIARAKRTGKPLSVLVLDVDHFKSINDTHGHAAGDQVLTDLARRAMAMVRSIDCFGRIGGEEFAALLPETDEPEARRVAERMRAALESPVSDTVPAQAGISYTVSIGIAQLREGESFDRLLERADTGLYKAKGLGRNRVMSAVAEP